jgi:ribosome-associated protein
MTTDPTGAAPQPADSTAAELAVAAARAIDDKKGEDITILEVGPILGITELFVITSAPNSRLVRTIVDEVEEQVFVLLDRRPVRVEGLNDRQWVLMDYGDVVVHVFADEARRFYEIERLYKDVPQVEWKPVTGAS